MNIIFDEEILYSVDMMGHGQLKFVEVIHTIALARLYLFSGVQYYLVPARLK